MALARKINILQLVNGFAIGGAEKKLLELVKRLDKDKYRIFVCSVGQGGPLQKDFEKFSLKVKVFPKKLGFDFSLIFKVARLMREEHIEILQTTLPYADIIGALAARLARVPVVISWETTSHGPDDLLHKMLRHRVGYRFAMRFVDKIVAVSEGIRRSLIGRRGISPDKIVIIPYGVDLTEFAQGNGIEKRKELGLNPYDPIVGVVARLEQVKGHCYFLQASTRIIEEFPKIKCVFVGDGGLKEELEAEVRARGFSSNFLFLGFRNDVQELLHIFDVFVLPSLSEGLPNVVLEAMACSKPVVATSVGGILEALVDGVTGLLVPPRDPDSLAHAVLDLLKNKDRALRMGFEGRKWVEDRFSLEREIEGFQQLYDELYRREVRGLRNDDSKCLQVKTLDH